MLDLTTVGKSALVAGLVLVGFFVFVATTAKNIL